MRKNINLNIKKAYAFSLMLLSIASIYIVPMNLIDVNSFIVVKQDLLIFNLMRILIIIFSVFSVLLFDISKKTIFTIYLLILLFIVKFVAYSEIDFGLIYIVSAFIIVEILSNNKGLFKSVDKLLNISYYTFILQIIICSYIYYNAFNSFRIVASNFDPNYTSYFGMILCYYFYKSNKKWKLYSLSILLLFTFSRLYFIALISFLVFKLIKISKVNIYIFYTIAFYILVQIILLIIGEFYIKAYLTVNPSYQFLEGFSRVGSFLDESNYIRVYANKLAIFSIDFTTAIIGLPHDSFIGLDMFKGKSIFPHNLLWSLFIQNGLIVSILFIKKYIEVFKKYSYGVLDYFFVILIFQSILGLSSFYGIDLIIQILVLKNIYIMTKENGEKYVSKEIN